MAYTLPPEIEQWVSSEIAAGRYANEREALQAAIEALEDKRVYDDFEAELRANGYEELPRMSDEDEDNWPAIKEALDGIEDRTNMPMTLDEAIADIKRRHGL